MATTTADVSTGIATEQAAGRRNRLRWIFMGGGVLVLLLAILLFWLFTGRYQSTDDATLRAAMATVSANISGRVTEIDVQDNQQVRRGDVLFKLDDRPYRIAIADATAKLATAKLQIGAAAATYRHQLAEVAAAQSTLAYRKQDFDRQQNLLNSGIASRAQFETAQHALDTAREQLTSAQQSADSVLVLLGGKPDLPVDQHPAVQQAQSVLDRANLDLTYTVVRAPDDGVVAKVEQLQVGDYISAAAPLFTVVSTRDIWVEANFKEDQLSYMRAGQRAEVKLDAWSGHTLKARVSSLSPGTGSQFSALPPENATGNWVKVVQRLPVRLQLETPADLSQLPLHSGLSATVSVDTEHHRSL